MTRNEHSEPSPAACFKQGMGQGLYSFFSLLKVIAPIYVAVAILKRLQVIGMLSTLLAPATKWFGLPAEASLAVVLGWTINIYAAVAAFSGLGLSARQVTILGVMLGISHTHFMETAIIGKMKARPLVVFSLRMMASLAIGVILNLVLPEKM